MSTSPPSSTQTATHSFPSFFTNDPAQATNTPTNTGGNGTSSSLYLFTFLATLFLLLFVSCAIILRSFILRRRFRRRVEEAILSGAMVPNARGPMGHRRDFGEKPRLWDSWIAPPAGDGWEDIMPVSVLPTSFKPPSARNHPSTPLESSSAGTQTPNSNAVPLDGPRPPFIRRIFRNPFAPVPPSPIPLSLRTPGLSSLQPNGPMEQEPETMQVSVLITMPTPRRLQGGPLKGKAGSITSEWDEDEELPEIVLGVAQRQYRSDGVSKVS
ncbi:hypothetical protein HETIRDRAFT_173276 [Heterobasidion irregulare TC 32-1]|uniref:Uncharacterized protein n=1 Tax=Heterobasidion irregulare (strain TC 32-1) TaxID=747525 RepID=W4K933_HETIT|nr:uncharacterized protein HETIRDRAFT_173276 [Heterobasidion irregulare TC 32-1]ETW81596.1 hypothetical protein HETIRDRAFT_173276 [Heterobasidion irregulare TC 32-1]